MAYDTLLSPLRLNSVTLRNRIIAAPMGVPRAKLLSTTYYGGISIEDKSLGGAAVVTVAFHGKDPFEKYERDATREICSVMRSGGALAAVEIPFHGEPFGADGIIYGPCTGTRFDGAPMQAFTPEIMDAYSDALAERCRTAREFGFDLLFLHFGHDSLCSQFLSPVFNRRTDGYGGSLENRMRFSLETLAKIRRAVGEDFPVIMRVSRQLCVPESYDEEDMVAFLKDAKRYVDMANISAGMDCYGGDVDHYEANVYAHSTVFTPRMHNLAFAERVRREVGMPVGLTGGVTDYAEAERILSQGKADAVVCGRALIADPYGPKKLMEGRPEDVVPCIRCLNCYHISTEHANTQCSVNPRFRRENRVPLVLPKTDRPKEVVVIGGGPAGCRAALAADACGHRVTLIEKSGSLGGQINCSEHGGLKSDLKRYRDYLRVQVEKSGIRVLLGTEADPDMVRKLAPDTLILALGARPKTVEIPGIRLAVQAVDFYRGGMKAGERVLIWGGGVTATELGLELAAAGHKVELIVRSDEVNKNGNKLYRIGSRHAMEAQPDLTVRYRSRIKEILPCEALIEDAQGEHRVPADTVILALGLEPEREQANAFYGIAKDTRTVGDCRRVGNVVEATNEGYFLGATI